MRPSRDPRYWGSQFWFVMHTVALFYPDFPTSDDMAHARNFYLSLQGVLPCVACGRHYTELLVKRPLEPALQSKMELMRWVWAVHQDVNARLGKEGPTFAEYLSRVQDVGAAGPRADFLLWGVVAAVVAVVVVRVVVNRRRAGR